MEKKPIDLGLTALDELFMTDEGRKENKLPRIHEISLDEIDDMPDHPYKVRMDEDMEALVESVKNHGIITPVILRQKENGRYECASGHRRRKAAELAGFSTIKAEIRHMTRDEAIIIMAHSNRQRSKILPSEKAFAYKLKMDALSRQGYRTDLTSRQVVGKLETADMIADNESGRQVQRYIRLTNLIPGILQKVDEGQIALTPAVELSYLTDTEQADLLETMESEDCTPSLSQAQQLKQLSQAGRLNMDRIFSIMREPKANQQEKISFKVADLRPYFPRHYNTAQMMQEIVIALKERQQRLQRQRNRDAR